MPYCPTCAQEEWQGAARCPRDGSFYVVAHCAACGAEVLPREVFCAACGQPAATLSRQSVAPLRPAPLPLRGAAAVLDALALLLLWQTLLQSGWLPAGHLAGSLAGVALALVYLTLLQARGRQTLGQFVTGTLTLTRERQVLSVATAARRVLLSALSWATLVLPLVHLARSGLSPAERWTDTRTWKSG